jgi:hypothetical protein
VGYAPHHDGDCYMMWDPHTQRIHESRDITWLKRMFYQKLRPTDLAVDPEVIEFETNPGAGAREGVDNLEEAGDDDDAAEQVDDDDGAGAATLRDAVTRSGRIVNPPACPTH